MGIQKFTISLRHSNPNFTLFVNRIFKTLTVTTLADTNAAVD